MRIRYTPEARADLTEIRSYIGKTLQNPAAASRTVAGITKECGRLKDYPNLGMSLEAKTGLHSEYRFLLCGKHIAFYRIEGSWVSIIRILDGRTDYLKRLFPEPE